MVITSITCCTDMSAHVSCNMHHIRTKLNPVNPLHRTHHPTVLYHRIVLPGYHMYTYTTCITITTSTPFADTLTRPHSYIHTHRTITSINDTHSASHICTNTFPPLTFSYQHISVHQPGTVHSEETVNRNRTNKQATSFTLIPLTLTTLRTHSNIHTNLIHQLVGQLTWVTNL